jgi:DNA polymerase I-like protein with 3'-5' exonuclease and polymerase domains
MTPSLLSSVGGWMAGVSAAWRQGSEVKSIYVPIEHPDSDCFDKDVLARWVKHILRRKRGRIKFCNAGYDLGWFNAELDLELPDGSIIDDVGCQAMMLDENRKAKPGFKSAFSLDGIADWLGIPGKDERLLRDGAHAYGYAGKDVKKFIAKLPSKYVGPYAEADAVATLLADEIMRPRISDDAMDEAYQTEMDLVPVIHSMRKRGVRLNVERCAQLGDRLMDRYEANCKKIYDLTKMRFDAGVSSEMDLQRSETPWREAEVDIAQQPVESLLAADHGRGVVRRAGRWSAGDVVLINLGGRGDKDVAHVSELLGGAP